ncbi:kinase-like protein [Ascoidea rubescens DSM 1968]|uniref:non-specific serine/threonine protein kinase n=1 Tax=Ascoidea rubescens DSM 1968 TaxID=1344418 RepID=A0A1D2VKA1_9ASCO|nr:kinase-like protein [Ascoidea rubescens DSM 1968]ODV62044.1 kinase-like protein [Ascoidea rubescens DSM 1968]
MDSNNLLLTSLNTPALDNYEIKECLGKGAFAIVYKAINKNTSRLIAIKQILIDSNNLSLINNNNNNNNNGNKNTILMSEINLLKSLNHKNIIKYYGYSINNNNLNLYLEYCSRGSLRSLYKFYFKKKNKNLSENLTKNYIKQVLNGLIYLHKNNIVHRDIKAANILLSSDNTVKLADFGVSINLNTYSFKNINPVGTPNWMAPEIITLEKITTSCDIWSLGATIIEILTQHPPYYELNAMAALHAIVTDEFPPLPKKISLNCKKFLLKCFEKNPNLRISAKELLNHQWLNHSLLTSSKSLSSVSFSKYNLNKNINNNSNSSNSSSNNSHLNSFVNNNIINNNINGHIINSHTTHNNHVNPNLSHINKPSILRFKETKNDLDHWDEDFENLENLNKNQLKNININIVNNKDNNNNKNNSKFNPVTLPNINSSRILSNPITKSVSNFNLNSNLKYINGLENFKETNENEDDENLIKTFQEFKISQFNSKNNHTNLSSQKINLKDNIEFTRLLEEEINKSDDDNNNVYTSNMSIQSQSQSQIISLPPNINNTNNTNNTTASVLTGNKSHKSSKSFGSIKEIKEDKEIKEIKEKINLDKFNELNVSSIEVNEIEEVIDQFLKLITKNDINKIRQFNHYYYTELNNSLFKIYFSLRENSKLIEVLMENARFKKKYEYLNMDYIRLLDRLSISNNANEDLVVNIIKIMGVMFENYLEKFEKEFINIGGIIIVFRFLSNKFSNKIKIEIVKFINKFFIQTNKFKREFLMNGGLFEMIKFLQQDYDVIPEMVISGINGIHLLILENDNNNNKDEMREDEIEKETNSYIYTLLNYHIIDWMGIALLNLVGNYNKHNREHIDKIFGIIKKMTGTSIPVHCSHMFFGSLIKLFNHPSLTKGNKIMALEILKRMSRNNKKALISAHIGSFLKTNIKSPPSEKEVVVLINELYAIFSGYIKQSSEQ